VIHAAAALLVAANWGIFIWASIKGHVAETGIGYIIAPFVAIGVGTLALKDPMSIVRRGALVVIVASVVLLLLRSGELTHWVYLIIAAVWGSYACLKKITTLDAFTGLLVETLVLTLCLCVLIPLTSLSMTLASPSSTTLLLLAASGLISVLPLWLFAHAAARLTLSVMGFFQFVLPSTQLIVALAFYRQQMSTNTLLCFGLIWVALLAIVIEPVFASRRQRRR
jgi:chloramphenicol-sensitive protein RarD